MKKRLRELLISGGVMFLAFMLIYVSFYLAVELVNIGIDIFLL